MDLLGRETELAAAQQALEAVRDGEARLLTVAGEAGIGKSALLDAVGARAGDAGLLVLAGRAAEHEQEIPFSLVIDAFDEHVAGLHPRRVATLGPDLAAVLPSGGDGSPGALGDAAERFRLHRAVRALVEMLGRERPVALLLDDLHWADDASLELVLHLLRRPPRTPLLLVIALRPRDPLPRLLAAARGARGWHHLDLAPLAHDAALGLLADVTDAARREALAHEAGGNPLFLQELARVAARPGAPLPPTLVAALRQEVEALPPASRALADGAAVAGDPFDHEIAAHAAMLDPTDALVPLDQLVAADIVRPAGQPGTFRFRHPLVHRALYDAAPPGWRLAAHGRAAAALAARGAPATVRAHHVERCARPGDDAAIGVLNEAGAAAAATAPAAAARWYAAVLRLLPYDDVPRRVAILGPLAASQAAAGRLEQARDTLLELLELVPSQARAQAIVACADLEALLGDHRRARERLVAARATAAGDERGTIDVALAMTAFLSGHWDGIRVPAELALDALPAHDARAVTAHGLCAVGALWDGDPSVASQALAAAAAGFADLPDDAIAAHTDAAWAGGGSHLLAERLPAAHEMLLRGIAVAREHRQGRLLAPMRVVLGMAEWQLARFDDALRAIEAGEEGARLAGVRNVLQFALWTKARVHVERAETAEAEDAAAEALLVLETLDRNLLTETGRLHVALLRGDQDPERAVAEATAIAGAALETADPTWRPFMLLDAVRHLIALDRVQEAEVWASAAAEHAARLQLVAGRVRGRMAQAEVLLAQDRAEDAAALIAGAPPAGRALAPWDGMHAQLVHGRALLAIDRRDDALALLHQLAAEAAGCGAARLHHAAARELRRAGARVSAPGVRAALRAGDGELTARERDIVELVVRGRTNKEVAATLFLSEKTVENNLSRVYAKLGVRSRVELAGLLAAEPGPGG